MTIQVDPTKAKLAKAYTGLGNFFGLTIGDPGNGEQPQNEAPLGPGLSYSRAEIQWSVSDDGTATGQCTIKADPGVYTHAILCSDMTDGVMIDNCTIGDVGMNNAGEIELQVTYTQS